MNMSTFAASSLETSPADAVLDVAERLRALGFRADAPRPVGAAALCFVSAELAAQPMALHGALSDLLGPIPFVAFVGASVFHDQRVPEKRPGLVVLVIEGVVAEARHAWKSEHAVETAAPLLADGPFATTRFLAVSAPAPGPVDVLPALDELGGDVVGGVAVRPQRHLLPGVSLLSVSGLRAVIAVSQAARHLGPVRTVTAAQHNVIRELDGRPALEMLMTDLPSQLRQSLSKLGGSLFASFSVDDDDTHVLRNVTGIDPNTGAVAVNAQPRVGTEITFSLRDQTTARNDLEEALHALEGGLAGRRPRAFVVFSSQSRDSALFGAPLWDVTRVLSRFGPDIPVVGSSGGAEVATCGAHAYVFGHAAVIAALL